MKTRKSKRKKKQDAIGRALIVFVAAAIIMAGLAAYYLNNNIASIDPNTLCQESGPDYKIVIIVDKSDAFLPLEKESVIRVLRDLSITLNKNEQIELYIVNDIERKVLVPEIIICNPGRGDEVNPWVANPALIERVWKEKYFDVIEQLIDSILKNSGDRTSPIMESIQSVAVTSFNDRVGERIPKKLVIISDMAQNSSLYTQYGNSKSYDEYMENLNGRHVHANLEGSDVEIYYIRRDSLVNIQGASHIDFWRRWISDSNGRLVHVVSIP